MGFPAQSYSILFSALLSASGDGVQSGYAVTKTADGKSYVVATTAALAVSATGTYDGIALQDGNAGRVIQIQRDAKVDKAAIPWMTPGAVEPAVIDANGKVQRASVASGITYGVVDKEGNVSIGTSGGSLPTFSIAGDVNESPLANKVYSISGNAGAVSILGGTWSIAAAIALTVTQLAPSSDAAVQDVTWETQSAFATAATNVTGGNFQVTLGSNKAALVTPWTNPAVPSLLVNYRDRATGVQNIASISPTRFFGAAGIGAGMYLSGANSWLDIGANPPLTIGVIGVDNGTDAIATRNFANSADMAVIGTDTSNYVVLARTGTAGVKVVPLAGSGTRVVTADASGVLGTTAIQTAPTGTGVWHSTSGVLDAAVSLGTANQVFVTNGAGTDTAWATTGGDVTGAITALVVGRLQGSVVLSGTPAIGNVLTATSTTAAHWAAPAAGTSPGGSNTQMQYNNAGAFGGTAEFTYASSKLNVASTGAITLGATPAAAGYIRATAASAIAYARNDGGSADLALLSTGSGNVLYVGGTSGQLLEPTIVYVQATSNVNLLVNATTILGITGSTTTFAGSAWAFGAGVVTHGSSVAGTGDFRVKNAYLFNALKAGGGDAVLFNIDSSNIMGVGGDTAHGSLVADLFLQATTEIDLFIGSTAIFTVSSGLASVRNGQNLSVGDFGAAMSSATNTIYIKDGTQPTGAPTSGVYQSSDSGSWHIRSSFSSAGVAFNMKVLEVAGGFGVIDPDHAIKIVIDKPGSAAQTRYLRMYT